MDWGGIIKGKEQKMISLFFFFTLNKVSGYQYYSLRKIYKESKLRYLRENAMVLPLICYVCHNINN